MIGHLGKAISQYILVERMTGSGYRSEAPVKWFTDQTWTIYEGVAIERGNELRMFGIAYDEKLPLFWVCVHGIYSMLTLGHAIVYAVAELKSGVDHEEENGDMWYTSPINSYAHRVVERLLGCSAANKWFNPLVLKQ